MEDERYAWLALNSIKGIGHVLYKRLLEEIGSPEEVFHSNRQALAAIEGLSPGSISEILGFKGNENIPREIDRMNALSVSLIHYFHPQYPSQLKNIYDPPPYFYMTGELWKQDLKSIAVVGTRKPTYYGKQIAAELTRDLVSYQLTIVSGFAMGIDQIAHQAALNAGGRTIAVLGCGIDVSYPSGSLPLKEAISAQGAVMTEFPMGMPASPENFPRRNRLISGLSLGVVVIEAAEKSGSLITATTALDQGKEVFAVPGPIHSELSKGTHALIKSGAKLVEKASDVLEELEGHFYSTQKHLPTPAAVELEPDEKKIYDIISLLPLHLDDISSRLSLPSQRCLELLLQLELKGLIFQVEGNQFTVNIMKKGSNG
jgi:DNA processing protein